MLFPQDTPLHYLNFFVKTSHVGHKKGSFLLFIKNFMESISNYPER